MFGFYIIAIFLFLSFLICLVVIERIIRKKLNDGESQLNTGRIQLAKYDRFPFTIFASRRLEEGRKKLENGERQFLYGLKLHRLIIRLIIFLLCITAVILVGLIINFFI